MGMYTEFVFGCELSKSTPENVIDILRYLKGDIEETPKLPSHEFFSCSRWKAIGRCTSAYFGSPSYVIIEQDGWSLEYRLAIRCNLKNYDNEIQKFVDWIKPYVNQGAGTGELLGYSIYEESSEPQMFYLYDLGG